MDEKQLGVVKWFNDSKGFGFINSNNQDYFVHFKEIKCDGFKTLPEGARVRFVAAKTEKGQVARNVTFESNSKE